jgi:hypothetical protein
MGLALPVLVLGLALLVSSCRERESRRLGEVYAYKAVPQEAVIGSDRSNTIYALRGLGYPASENANRLFDVFSGLGVVGPLVLLREAERLHEESLRSYRLLEVQDKGNSPTAKALQGVAAESLLLAQSVRQSVGENQGQLWAWERRLSRAIYGLVHTRRFLSDLRRELSGILNDVYDDQGEWIQWPDQRPGLTLKYPLFLYLGGQPLTSLEISQGKFDLAKGHQAEDRWPPSRPGRQPFVLDDAHWQDSPFKQFADDALAILIDTHIPVGDADQQAISTRRKKSYQTLVRMLRRINEGCLVIKRGLDLQWPYLPVYQRQPHEVESDNAPPFQIQIVDAVRYKDGIGAIQTNVRSAEQLIGSLVTDLGRDLAILAEPFVEQKVSVEVLARRYDRLVPRHPNRALQLPTDPNDPPTRLTVLLKRLFIRYLDTGDTDRPPGERGASVLVTCEVESGKTVRKQGAPVAPVVLERNYSPGHLVNVRDRLVYGPAVYHGEFLNIKLSVVRLSNINKDGLGAGLDMAVGSLSKFSPGLAAASPFVSAFFRGILNNVDKDAKELEFQFTFPALEGAGKADVDMLIAETGHYILLKRENRYREEYEIEASTRRYTDADLIYNPEDSLLYHRRDMENPRNNFVPENLFTAQTYLVFAVTDEYVNEDNLGAALRQQLAGTLGEEVSRSIIPDAAMTQTMMQQYRQLSDFTDTDGVLLDGEGIHQRQQLLEGLQDELWGAGSDYHKAMVVESLYGAAASAVQQRLGRDIDLWRKAELRVRDDGRLDFR